MEEDRWDDSWLEELSPEEREEVLAERREANRPLTDEEVEQWRVAIDRAQAFQAYLLKKYGRFDPPAWELLHEAREERMRQLS